MNKQELHLPHVKILANRLITDIRQRGLTVGDRYLTTAEAGRMLGVRKAVVGKAIKQLAEREILIPRQRYGTFVGPGLEKSKGAKVRTIYVLLSAGEPTSTHWPFQPFIAGIRNSTPEVNVQFTFIPETDPIPYIQELIEEPLASGQLSGVVPVSCPPEVYRFLAEMHVPTAVYGTLYAPELAIASIDVDSFQCGLLLTEYLISRGHHHLGLIMTGGGRPGDHLFIDGVSEALSTVALPHNALILRANHSYDMDAFHATTKELLTRVDRPTAIITRGGIQAGEVASVAAELELSMPDDLEIALDNEVQTMPHIDLTSFPRVVPKWSFVDIAAAIGKVLRKIAEDASSRPQRIVVPVEFHKPEYYIL